MVRVANKFLKEGHLIVSTKGRAYGSDQEYFATKASAHSELPLVALVSRGTASGAEILAGAIQDHGRGLIVGESTFGRGTIQSVYRISEGNGLVLTTARYYTPSGRSIQDDDSASPDDIRSGSGIVPDIHVTSPTLPPPLLYLLSVQAFSRYAVRFAPEGGRRPASPMGASELPIPMHARLIDQRFEVDEEALSDFFDFLKQEGVDFSREELLQHRDTLATLLKQQIFTALWGEGAGVRATIARDPQVQRALEVIPEAAKLPGVSR